LSANLLVFGFQDSRTGLPPAFWTSSPLFLPHPSFFDLFFFFPSFFLFPPFTPPGDKATTPCLPFSPRRFFSVHLDHPNKLSPEPGIFQKQPAFFPGSPRTSWVQSIRSFIEWHPSRSARFHSCSPSVRRLPDRLNPPIFSFPEILD